MTGRSHRRPAGGAARLAAAMLALALSLSPGAAWATTATELVERVLADFAAAAQKGEPEAARQAFMQAVRRHLDRDHVGEALLPGRWAGLPAAHRNRVGDILASYVATEIMRRWRPGEATQSEIVGTRTVSGLPAVGVRVAGGGREEVVILVLSGAPESYRLADLWRGGASLLADMQGRLRTVGPLDLSTPDRIVATLACRLLRQGC